MLYVIYMKNTVHFTGKNRSSECQLDAILSLFNSPEYIGNNVLTLSKKDKANKK